MYVCTVGYGGPFPPPGKTYFKVFLSKYGPNRDQKKSLLGTKPINRDRIVSTGKGEHWGTHNMNCQDAHVLAISSRHIPSLRGHTKAQEKAGGFTDGPDY